MNRDSDILRVFEIADDSLMGVLGYHYYVTSMQYSVDVEKIWKNLPKEDEFPCTFSWNRYYQKQDLTEAMIIPIVGTYQSRISLIAMTNIFSVALKNFIRHLDQKGHKQVINGMPYYKTHIKWAYKESLNCDIGDKDAIERLPFTYGTIDNARRLRNLIVHNHGLFEEFYEVDAITSDGIKTEFNPHYKEVFKKNPQIPTPIIITMGDIIRFSKSHIEALHVLYNYLQKKYFGVLEPYDYRKEKKSIEWTRVLWGDANVKVLFRILGNYKN